MLNVAPTCQKLSIVIPAFNEHNSIEIVVQRALAVELPIEREIILVDDGSNDGTVEIIRRLEATGRIRAYYHSHNMGKGACLRTAFQNVQGDFVLIQDADLEYDPEDYHRLLQPLLDSRADVVIGSRFHGEAQRVHMFSHRIANAALTFLSNLLTNLNLSDMECGYKVFRQEVLDSLQIREDRFGVEPEIVAKVARRKYRIYEVPISYSGRDYSEGKKIGLKDAVRALWCIFRYWIAD